jgi:hypothetical protein
MPDDSPEIGVESRFLHGLYPDLSRSAEVGKVALRSGVPNTAPPVDKIGAYLEYLESIEGSDEQERIIEEIIESSIREPIEPNPKDTENRRMVDIGLANEIEGFDYEGLPTPDNASEIIRNRQRAGLKSWFDYLYGEEQDFPAWFRFYVATDLVRMAAFNQEKSEFPRRSRKDNQMFPEMDQEALAETRETIMSIFADEPNVPEEISKNPRFRSVYSYHFNNLRSIPEDELQITDGEWAVFETGSDPAMLAETLSGRGSGWCLAVYADAARYLKKGDVLIYFSENKDGTAVNPRIAIATDSLSALVERSSIKPEYRDKKTIREIRGILSDQEMEPLMFDTVEEKLHELEAEGEIIETENYIRRLPGLRSMAEIEEKIESGQPLSIESLAFLYGIPYTPTGFGGSYGTRLAEIRAKRNEVEDCERLFGCKPDEVAFDDSQLNGNTRIYIPMYGSAVPYRLPENLKIMIGDLHTSGIQGADSLGNLETVWGDLDLSNAWDIASLGNLHMVSGDLITYRDEHMRVCRLNDIGKLQFIGGSVEFMAARVRDFKGLRFIGGDATFPHLPIEAFEGLEYIGGNATIAGVTEEEFRQSVHVAGDVIVIEPIEYEKTRSKLREFLSMLLD